MDEKILLRINSATKYYTDENGIINNLFENISFDINDNEFLSIVATSGLGKSTLLKVLAGLESLSEGNLEIDADRKIIYIPSNPSSLPNLNVLQNVKTVIQDSNIDLSKIIMTVGLEGYENHLPDNKELKFKISLARALANNPDLILLDDPFEEFPLENKSKIYELINNIYSEYNISFILATTNISEALFLSDKIILLNGKPAVFIASVKTNFSKIRNQSLKQSSNFIELRKKIEKLVDDNK